MLNVLHVNFMSCIYWDLHLHLHNMHVYIYDIPLHDTMQNILFYKCKSMCSTLMKVLHYPLLLEIMVCVKVKVLHLTLFLGGCGFLNQSKIITNARWKRGTCFKKSLMKLVAMLKIARSSWYHHLNLKIL